MRVKELPLENVTSRFSDGREIVREE